MGSLFRGMQPIIPLFDLLLLKIVVCAGHVLCNDDILKRLRYKVLGSVHFINPVCAVKFLKTRNKK